MEDTVSGGKKYLIISVLIYTIGYFFLTYVSHSNPALFIFLSLYFIVLPGFYIHWVMRPQKRSWYKIFFIFFIGVLAVKISFPDSIINYFEDFSTLRAAILLIIITMNIRMFFSIFKNISRVRRSKNDPRFEIAIDKNKKPVAQQKIEMLIASELVNWYYFLGRYPSSNRKYHLISKSRNAWILWLILSLVGISSLYCFWVLYSYNILIAALSSLFILYSIPMIVANYRMAKYESIYIKGNYLVVNYAIWAITAISVIPISNLKLISSSSETNNKDKSLKRLGRVQNTRLQMRDPITYHGFMGQLPKEIKILELNIFNADLLKNDIESHNAYSYGD